MPLLTSKGGSIILKWREGNYLGGVRRRGGFFRGGAGERQILRGCYSSRIGRDRVGGCVPSRLGGPERIIPGKFIN